MGELGKRDEARRFKAEQAAGAGRNGDGRYHGARPEGGPVDDLAGLPEQVLKEIACMYAALGVAVFPAIHNMFYLSVPLLEKVVRPWIVYLSLVVLLRLFGKRELAQLNPFDLVVLLSLSNTVQNAIIGDDNSVTGGLIGAFSLLTINWLLNRVLYSAPKLNATLQGQPAILVRNGTADEAALKRERLSAEELIGVLNKNGFGSAREVEICILEPNGSFYVKGLSPSPDELRRTELLEALRQLTAEVHALR